MNERVYRYVAIGILIVALSLRLMGLNKGMHLDEGTQLELAQRGGVVDVVVNFIGNAHPPLYFIVLHFWSQLSNNEVFLRLPSVLMGMATVLVIMLWLKRYSSLASIIAGALVATAPMLLTYSQEIRDYPLLLLATALTFFFASRAAMVPDRLSSYVGLGLSLTLAVASHLISIFLVLPVCAFLFCTPEVRSTIRWFKLILALAIPTAIFLVLDMFYLAPAINPIYTGIGKSSGWWAPPISRWVIVSALSHLFGFSALPWSWGVTKSVLLAAFPCFAITVAFGNWRRSIPFLIAALTFWLQIVGYTILINPLFVDRFLVPSLVPLLGFVSLLVASIERKALRIASMAICVSVSLTFALSWATKRAWEPREPWKQMSQYLQSQFGSRDLLVLYPGYEGALLRYYFPELQPAATLEISPGTSGEALAELVSSKITSINKTAMISHVFLVVRYDVNASKHTETLQRLISILKEQIRGWPTITMLSFRTAPPIEDLFTAMTSVLGLPLYVRDFGPFVSHQYELHR
jgi:uncharacterized membrane protein